METVFRMLLVVVYVALNAKLLNKCIYFRVPRMSYPKLMPLCINYRTDVLVSVVRKSIIDIMLAVRRINYSSLLSLEMICLSIFQSYILALRVYLSRVSCIYFQAYILVLQVYFSWVSCLFFKPTSLLRKSILVKPK